MRFFGALAVAMLSLADCSPLAAVPQQLVGPLQPGGMYPRRTGHPVPARDALGILYPHVEGLFFYPTDRRRAACDCWLTYGGGSVKQRRSRSPDRFQLRTRRQLADAAGNLYGTAYSGGPYDGGVVYQLSPDGRFKVLYSFTGTGGDGALPYANLIIGADGALYGTTLLGGLYQCVLGFDINAGCGTVFKIEKRGNKTNETVLHRFTGTDGSYPVGSLTFDARGNLYGTTYYGANGACSFGGCGTVFELDKNGNLTTVYAFSGSDGANPSAGLVWDGWGNLYGTTQHIGFDGPLGSGGTAFKLRRNGLLTTLYSFGYAPDDPQILTGHLARDAKGNLYGTGEQGGAYGYGGVYKLTPP